MSAVEIVWAACYAQAGLMIWLWTRAARRRFGGKRTALDSGYVTLRFKLDGHPGMYGDGARERNWCVSEMVMGPESRAQD